MGAVGDEGHQDATRPFEYPALRRSERDWLRSTVKQNQSTQQEIEQRRIVPARVAHQMVSY